MIFVENDSKNAAFYFSLEELFVRYIKKSEPVFILWQSDKTVMLGNNQEPKAEVNTKYAGESGINIVRRTSGGGAIYTDLGTVLYTVIEPLADEITVHREKVAANIIDALKKMGVPAYREGKNDILADGMKISGIAQYSSGSHLCTHGSLLYDTDMEALTQVLIPDIKKLQPKGITSIRSRVTNIKPYLKSNLTAEEFIIKLRNNLLNDKAYSVYTLNKDELNIINNIYIEKYSNDNWNFGNE